jgi:GNAT superfamily N-acetyltransferase
MQVKTTYLEMLSRPQRSVPPPRGGLRVVHASNPSVAQYRALYDAVGGDYDWTTRRRMSDADLAAILDDPRDELHVLEVDGAAAGFAELDRRREGEIELVQFGLMRAYLGQGLGKWFLQWTIDKAWSYGPRRFWLHTCTKDHPAALPNYLQAGFTIFKEEIREA